MYRFWAVGAAGTILRYQSGAWSPADSPTVQDLYGLYMLSPTEGWAVGGNNGIGVILHYDGTAWRMFDNSGATAIP